MRQGIGRLLVVQESFSSIVGSGTMSAVILPNGQNTSKLSESVSYQSSEALKAAYRWRVVQPGLRKTGFLNRGLGGGLPFKHGRALRLLPTLCGYFVLGGINRSRNNIRQLSDKSKKILEWSRVFLGPYYFVIGYGSDGDRTRDLRLDRPAC